MADTVAPADRIDSNVKIPAAVKASAAKADAAFHAARGEPDPKAPVVELKPEPAPQPTPQPEPVTQRGNPGDADWQHRYESMKGRFDQSQSELRSMAARVQNLEGLLAAKAPAAPMPAELNPQRLVSSQEENDYGAEFLDVVGRKAREIAEPKLSQLEQKLNSLESQVVGVGTRFAVNERQQLFNTLDGTLPNWREVNTSQKFLAWLALPDTYSGAIRHQMLNAAFERHDAPRVLAFFKGFLAEEAAIGPPRTELAPTPQGGKVPLESFAAPGRAKSAAASPAPAEKPFITRAQIASFYAEVRAGKYRGRDDEKNRLENMIFSAQQDGRVTQ